MVRTTLKFEGLGTFGRVIELKQDGITRYFLSETLAKEAVKNRTVLTHDGGGSKEEIKAWAEKYFDTPLSPSQFLVNLSTYEDKELGRNAWLNRLFLRYRIVDKDGMVDVAENHVSIFYQVVTLDIEGVKITHAYTQEEANAIFMFKCLGFKAPVGDSRQPQPPTGVSYQELLEFVSGKTY